MVFTLPFALPAFAGDSMDTYPAYGVNAPSPLADTSDFVLSGTTLTSYTGTDEEVVIPEGVTRINRDAFKGNTTMKRVILPTSCDYIQYVFHLYQPRRSGAELQDHHVRQCRHIRHTGGHSIRLPIQRSPRILQQIRYYHLRSLRTARGRKVYH